MGDSTCVACGECVQACPTGALMPARDVGKIQSPTRPWIPVCPYCGRGMPAHLQRQGQQDPLGGRVADGPANSQPPVREGTLRLRLRAAQAPAHPAAHPQARREKAQGLRRRSRQLVARCSARRAGRRRSTSPANGLRDIRDTHGKKALAGFGSAKGTNEEAYLFQKLVRTGFGSNNVDHCTRLCHASIGRRAHGGHQLGRGLEPGARRDERGGDLPHRRQPHGEPPGGGDLDEERRQGGREADRRRSAPGRASRATRPTTCSSRPTPTWRC